MHTTPLSPLQIKSHRFTNFRVKCVAGGNAAGLPALRPTVWFEPPPSEQGDWRLVLALEIASEEPEKPWLYEGEIEIQGVFAVAQGFPEEKKNQLALVNGFSLLYSSAREMFINLTARSAYGIVSLPTLSFVALVNDLLEGEAKKSAPVENDPDAQKV